ncbi:hypothetical protein HG536_0B00780 [Torulaspora globosa]|uniref:Swi6 N-terminal domain-containing protein n=1 Tax=Torulaspora globosa TaxID=48254 RepID=A0A7G3ZCI1_9SACH|nr:uncharacterized protein HG536_0B00780 [Torulaspora globosa]QLL31217.1 hypothetical protein HG536_0B00780 [Torulaspora globosa]
MSVVEATKLIGEKASLTLKKSTETGYFLLRPFLPLLQHCSQLNGDLQFDNVDLGADQLSMEQEDALLSQYGILVDTNDAGEKWITGDKAHELLEMLNLGHLFQDAFSRNKSVDGVAHAENAGLGDQATDPESREDQSNGQGPATESQQYRDTAGNKSIKRVSKDIELAGNSQKGLGSPLKKLRLDSEKNENLEENPDEKALATRPICTFRHDTDHLSESPVIQRAQAAVFVSDNSQRIKLETFLQRLLFPTAQDMASPSSSNASHSVPFEDLLHEVDLAHSHVPLNLNIPVDERGNTPLHWLASIANLELVKKLVEHGSNRLIGDNIGESALVKAVKSVNNYDSGTFEELLDYLYPCLILEDSMNRTILHHIVITSGMAGCSAAAKYYLDILMGWIVKKQSRPLTGAGSDKILEALDLKWVINNMLNAVDSNGDTSLNIASRLGNVAIVDALLDYGADPYVANKSGLRPVDFGAGTTKLHYNGASNLNLENPIADSLSHDQNGTNLPDTMSLIKSMQSLLSTVSQDYNAEVKEYQEKLNKLHKELNAQRELLAASRDRLAHAKQLKDEYILLRDQLNNLKQGIIEEGEKFQKECKNLGLNSEDAAGADWDSSEFDADEPFRVDFIYEILEKKLAAQYNGDIDKLLTAESTDSVLEEVRSQYSAQHDNDKLDSLLPPSVLLKARINAYKRNDKQLDNAIAEIQQKQQDLEGKFRRVLCLCLKIDEDKVDDMLDGLLQAISSEDPQDVDTDEMHDFLKKHNV